MHWTKRTATGGIGGVVLGLLAMASGACSSQTGNGAGGSDGGMDSGDPPTNFGDGSMDGTSMEFSECASVNGWTVWTIAGSLDVQAASDLKALLMGAVASGKRWLALDLERVTSLGSPALKVLVDVANTLGPARGAVALAQVAPQVRRGLEISGVLKLLVLVDHLSQLPERPADAAP